jgi:hypothetical protein
MCDKGLVLGYLYGELSASDREAFDRHLASCAECRSEVEGLRRTRTHLASWAPPEPDLGFQIIRSAAPIATASPRWWRPSPAWGLAAAATLLLAVSAAIANVEVGVGTSGIVVRTGWSRETSQPSAAAVSPEQLQRVSARLQELEGQLADRRNAQAAATPAAVTSAIRGMTDAQLLKLVREWIAESEERQQGVLARQILQVSRDHEAARRTDFDRLLVGLRQVQGTTAETFNRQRALEDMVVRVGMQQR